MFEAFIDLDELIVRCKDKQARKLIQEAVACYRAGAFRSSIVSTWNAVVFDFLHKLRDLALLGDKEASNLLQKFEKLSLEENFRELWKFESDIPDKALSKFELISSIEKSDIERLFKDRSRCAHPSMTSLEEPFEATAELARYHLRSAVTHFLQYPPVQGRAAKERIFQDIKSQYFPVEPERAQKHFETSPLARARFSLIQDVVRGLTISLLTEDFTIEEIQRQFSALKAISSMYPKEIREILNSKYLSQVIISRVSDENWDKVIIYLGTIEIWDNLEDSCRLKAESFINKLEVVETYDKHRKRISEQTVSILIKASHICFLRESVRNRLCISIKDLLSIKETCNDNVFETTIVFPILQELAPQATFEKLLLMRENIPLELNNFIDSPLKEKAQELSLIKLVRIMSTQKEKIPDELLELELDKKIASEDLGTLLIAKSEYISIEEPNPKIIESFDASISKKVANTPFDNLLEYSSNWDEIAEELLQPILKKNVSAIIRKFAKSTSYNSAAHNLRLLMRVVEYLEPIQWQNILEIFFENDQIYDSYGCIENFETLFEKSLEINQQSLSPYWLPFRQKLNDFNKKSFEKLKRLIDANNF
jgi:hypothetical protein